MEHPITSVPPPEASGVTQAPSASTQSQGDAFHWVGRLAIWLTAAGVSWSVDLITKSQPHPIVLHHYRHSTALDLIPLGLFLFCFALSSTPLFALGTGLMFGGLLGNGGELLRHGYATDWILVGHYVTNIADISLVAGLICLYADLVLLRRRRRARKSLYSPWTRQVAFLCAASCAVLAGLVTGDLRIGESVFLLILIEAFVLERLMRRRSRYA